MYKFLPNRKLFIFLCATLTIVFCISAFVQIRSSRQEVYSRAEIEHIREQQKIFGDWYAAYQKDIEHLDRNWQLFHSIIETLKTEEIYELSIYEQLQELELDALDEREKIHALKVPADLDLESAALLSEIIKKTCAYIDAQSKTISAVREAANPENFKDLPTLNRKITDITIRESPTGLFTAQEVSAIRESLIAGVE